MADRSLSISRSLKCYKPCFPTVGHMCYATAGSDITNYLLVVSSARVQEGLRTGFVLQQASFDTHRVFRYRISVLWVR